MQSPSHTQNQRLVLMESALKTTGSTTRWRKIREEILRRDGYICYYCHGNADSVDHVVPRSKIPEDMKHLIDHPDNLVAACMRCNRAKSDRNSVFLTRETTSAPCSVVSLPETVSTVQAGPFSVRVDPVSSSL